MKNPALLGGLTPRRFLREYWHKKPLLIRQAFPSFMPVLGRDALFALAARDDVESRLISHARGRWRMQHGPLDRLPGIARKGWTMLVQGVNLHVAAADELMQQFRFIPDSRLDDLMISYASDGGGVGPHFDSYDVFLLQAQGKRRWRISAQDDLGLVDGMPLKILRNFQAEQEFELDPGDMLYLPPHYAHDGIAVGECMTYSIGFRAPSYQELGESFLQFMAEAIELPGRYADPGLAPARHPAQIERTMLERIRSELQKIRFSRDDVTIFLGEYLSEPKASVFFEVPTRPLNASRFHQSAIKRGIVLSAKTRMLYRDRHVFINGEGFATRREDRETLALLADQRCLSGLGFAGATGDVREAIYAWYRNGWLTLS